MKNRPPIAYQQYQFREITHFLDILTTRKCVYYATDFLQANTNINGQLSEVEELVQHTLQVFKTLDIPTDKHFYAVYRSGPRYVFKDWRLSELACVYLWVNGDPNDFKTLARQQTELIDQMLQHIQPQQLSSI